MCRGCLHPLPRARQRGAAAIEAAFMLSLLLLLLTGLMGFGAMLWAKQQLAAAAGEGARAALESSLGTGLDEQAACQVAEHASHGMSTGCTALPQTCTWVDSTGGALKCITVTLSFDTAQWPLMNLARNLAGMFDGNESWQPGGILTSTATIQIP